MKQLAILIHGFNVWDPRLSVGRLRPFFARDGVPYVMVNYGWVGLIGTRVKNRRIAKRVAKACHNAKAGGHQVIVVGHSNGCAIAHVAAKYFAAEIDQAVYINPALEKGLAPPASMRQLHVWHSPGDWPVKWSKWLLPSSARPWGEMGATGYTGPDPRVTNFNKQSGFDVVSNGHSDLFDTENIAYFGPIVARQAAAAIGTERRDGRQTVAPTTA